MANQVNDPELYELHMVEREELHEEWVWIRSEDMKRFDGRRPALLFEYKGNSVCCETLYADDTYLRNRHHSILVGEITDVRSNEDFTVEWGGHHKYRVSVAVKKAEKCASDADRQELDKNQLVRVYCPERGEGIMGTDDQIEADYVRLGEGNLVFINAWYRRKLGINEQAGEKIRLKITLPDRWWQAMWWQLLACVQHPQIAITMSMVLAIIGTGLGIMGLAVLLKDLSGWKDFLAFDWASLVAAVFGFIIIFVVGLGPLYFRAKHSIRNAK
jgi:hypothetical protein